MATLRCTCEVVWAFMSDVDLSDINQFSISKLHYSAALEESHFQKICLFTIHSPEHGLYINLVTNIMNNWNGVKDQVKVFHRNISANALNIISIGTWSMDWIKTPLIWIASSLIDETELEGTKPVDFEYAPLNYRRLNFFHSHYFDLIALVHVRVIAIVSSISAYQGVWNATAMKCWNGFEFFQQEFSFSLFGWWGFVSWGTQVWIVIDNHPLLLGYRTYVHKTRHSAAESILILKVCRSFSS